MLRTQIHKKIETRGVDDKKNGFLIPIYNMHDHFFKPGREPQQVYLTVLDPWARKGPHLHYVRVGFFTCIKGNVRIVTKENEGYQQYFSGEDYQYQSIEVPVGIPAILQNLGDDEAIVMNMPNPAWTPDMNDEQSADFSDFDFKL